MYKCKECGKIKKLSEYYKHPLTKDGIMHRCKNCIKKGRKSDHELNLSRSRDKERYKNNLRRRLYCVRRGMNGRCYDPSNSHYKWYGKRGIKIEWVCFDDFYNDMIDLYKKHGQRFGFDRKNCQIDRINNCGNYSKNNCRFVSAKQNNEHNKKNKD